MLWSNLGKRLRVFIFRIILGLVEWGKVESGKC